MLNLKSARLAKGLNQQDVANYLGISQPAYANYERGARQADYETLKKLSDYFGVSVDYLLGKEEKTPTIDEQMNDIEFALYGEVKDLTDEQKQEILDFVKFKKLQEKFGEK